MVGDVTLDEDVSVWYGAVLLGSLAKIVKEIAPEQREEIRLDGENYIRLAQAQAIKEV